MQNKTIFAAERSNEIVGFGILGLDKREMLALYISPTYVGQRIGTRLLEKLEEESLKNGIGSIQLLSTLNAVSFYE